MTHDRAIFETDPSLRFLTGAGEMRARIREFDWSTTPLGDPEQWSDRLKIALAIMLDSAAPSYIAWGPDYVQFYNDAYISVLGPRKHPHALGRTTPESWWEIWDIIGPLFDRVRTSGNAVGMQNALLPMRRADIVEECYFNFTYSPLADRTCEVIGIFVLVWETTYEVISTRRANAIRSLVQGLAEVDTYHGIRSVFESTCHQFSSDMPFGLWYDLRENLGGFELAVAAGIAPGSILAPVSLDPQRDDFYAGLLNPDTLAPGSRSFAAELAGPAIQRPLGENPIRLFVYPLSYTNALHFDDVIVLGVNPLRPDDEAQQEFFESVRSQLERACGRVRRFELEGRKREHDFTSVMSVLPCMVWTSNTEKQIVYVNQTWLNFTGRTLEQEVGDGWTDNLHPEDTPRLEQARRETDGQKIINLELRLRRADGQYRWVFSEASPRFNIDGEFTGYIGTAFDVSDRKETEQRALDSQAELRKLYDLLQTTRDEERRALAREVHDQLGQILSAAKIDVALLEQDFAQPMGTLSRSEILTELRSARAMMEKSIGVVRQLATDLRPPEIDSHSLPEAIMWHARDFERRTKIVCEVRLQPDLPVLNGQITAALFRIFQEAMTNVLRHSKASRVRISLTRSSNHVRLHVRDNGVGILRVKSQQSNGLKGMRERAAIAGGRLVVGPVGNSGTMVGVRIPLSG